MKIGKDKIIESYCMGFCEKSKRKWKNNSRKKRAKKFFLKK